MASDHNCQRGDVARERYSVLSFCIGTGRVGASRRQCARRAVVEHTLVSARCGVRHERIGRVFGLAHRSVRISRSPVFFLGAVATVGSPCLRDSLCCYRSARLHRAIANLVARARYRAHFTHSFRRGRRRRHDPFLLSVCVPHCAQRLSYPRATCFRGGAVIRAKHYSRILSCRVTDGATLDSRRRDASHHGNAGRFRHRVRI